MRAVSANKTRPVGNAKSTAVATVATGRRMMTIDTRKINYGLAKGIAEAYSKSVGGGEGFEKKETFPGIQHNFKSGEWIKGWGKDKKVLRKATVVVNVPNMMAGWCWWEDIVKKDGDETRIPKYSDMRFPAIGQPAIEREEMGQLDQKKWEKGDDGKPQDPVKPVLVFPIRDENGTEVNHVMLTSKSAVIAGFNFFRDVAEEMMMHDGELPIVALGAGKASMKKVEKKNGKDVKKTYTWDVPTFEVVGWTDAQDCDNPTEDGGVVVTKDEDADLGEVTTKSRVGNGHKPSKLTKAEKAVLEGKKAPAKRKQLEVDEDSDL